jgi:hypothetical protein
MRKLVILALALSLVMGMASLAGAVTIGYTENFQSYTNLDDLWADRGNPIYYGRIGGSNGPSPYYDMFLSQFGGNKYVTFEDDTGMFLQIDTTGYENVSLSFNWATGSTTLGDYAQVGYYVGDISNLFNDGYANNDITGGFTEINLGTGVPWQSYSLALAADTASIWVFLGLNDGNGDFAKFDNLSLTGEEMRPVPVPAAVWLLGSGLVGLAGLKRKYFG